MHFTTIASALLVASVAAQNYGNGDGSYSWGDWSSTSTEAAATSTVPAPALAATQAGEIIIQVVSVSDAGASLKYFPDNIQAPVGSIVQFQFHPKNHTITESSFANPCHPIAANLTSATRPGIKSGFVPVTGTETSTPVYNLLVNDTKPIWLYCGQTSHCQKGMAMVINQVPGQTEKTIENYIAAAMALPVASPAGSSAPAYGASSAAPAASQTYSPSFSTAGSLPTPTSGTATSSITNPATFTGAASKQNIVLRGGAPAFAGLLFGGGLMLW